MTFSESATQEYPTPHCGPGTKGYPSDPSTPDERGWCGDRDHSPRPGTEEYSDAGAAEYPDAAEYPGVPAPKRVPAPEGESVPSFWERLAGGPIYETVEQVRDALDRPDWREVERAKKLSEEARHSPAREIDPNLGACGSRSYRQVNVKLGHSDFIALTALAIERDVPPSTMGRILLRRAIGEAAGEGSGCR